LVALSGGADSALLLYLVAKELINSKQSCSLGAFTIPRPDGGVKYSPKIVEYINQKLNLRMTTPMIVGNGDLSHTTVVETAIAGLLSLNYFDYVYVAENKIPPIHIDSLLPVRSPSKNAWKRLILPFYDLNKSDIIDLYHKEGIEDLLTLSHSCTGLQIGRCNVCFNCQERDWAFKFLNKLDPGTQ
jgi:hypothetical protein